MGATRTWIVTDLICEPVANAYRADAGILDLPNMYEDVLAVITAVGANKSVSLSSFQYFNIPLGISSSPRWLRGILPFLLAPVGVCRVGNFSK